MLTSFLFPEPLYISRDPHFHFVFYALYPFSTGDVTLNPA